MRNIFYYILFFAFLLMAGCASKKVAGNTKEQTFQSDSGKSTSENLLFVDTSFWDSGIMTHAHIEFEVDTTASGATDNAGVDTGTTQNINIMGILFPFPKNTRLKNIDLTTIGKSKGQKGVSLKAEENTIEKKATQVTNKAETIKETKTPVSAVRYWWIWCGLFVILLVWCWFKRKSISNWIQYIWGWIRSPPSL